MTRDDYIFTSERLGFRTWSMEFLDEFAKLNADPVVMEQFPATMSRNEVEDFIEKLDSHFTQYGYTYYATEILDTKEFIGMIGLAYQKYETEFTPAIDIGWRLKRAAWGNGYATEGANRCLEHGFNDLGIEKIISVCTENNVKSENVMKKIGMTKKGEFDHPEVTEYPELIRHYCYSISKKEKEA